MTSPADLLRSSLTAGENALVPDRDVDEALRRACAGLRPRTRVDVAALRVYAGPASTRVPPLESRPLRRPLLVRLWTGRARPAPVAVVGLARAPFEPCRAETRVPLAA